jgi:hypothetical protein
LKIWPIIWVAILLRLAYAFWNGFYGPAPGADGDALEFYDSANLIALGVIDYDWGIGQNFYINFLGLAFYLFGSSVFLASLISVVAWSLSALLLFKSLKILRPEESHVWPLSVYSVLPFEIIYSSIQLREPFQLLFVNCIAFGAIKILKQRAKWGWVFLLIGCLGAGSLHGTLAAFAGITFLAIIAFPILTRGSRLNFLQIVVSTILIGLVFAYGLTLFSTFSYNLSGGTTDALKTYQEGSLRTEARANYKLGATDGSFFQVTIDLFFGLLQYFGEPFPWKIEGLADIFLTFENCLRFYFIIYCLKQLRNKVGHDRSLMVFFISLYLIVEGIWSIGTVNWGTASRHHLPSFGLLLIAYSLALGNKSLREFKKNIQFLVQSTRQDFVDTFGEK